MTKPARYHHGDLRAALLSAARRALDEDGHEKLSLSRITASLGVSPAAPYRHFASKEALLDALVELGAAEFETKAEAAAATPGDALDKLRAACVAYLDYAEQMPGLFRLLLGSADGQPYVTEPPRGVYRAYHIFEELVGQVAPALSNTQAQSAAASVASQLHGYIVLSAGGLFKPVADTLQPREATIEAAVRIPAILEAVYRQGRSSGSD